MSLRDIEIALAVIGERLPHLSPPRRLDPRAFPAGHRCLGQYRLLSDTVRLNACYLQALDEQQALALLDTLVHELLHRHSGWFKQLRDTFLPHPDIYAEAARLAALLGEEFLHRRRAAPPASAHLPRERRVMLGSALGVLSPKSDADKKFSDPQREKY